MFHHHLNISSLTLLSALLFIGHCLTADEAERSILNEKITLKLDDSSKKVSHSLSTSPTSHLHMRALRPTGGDACFGQNQGVFLQYGQKESCRLYLKWNSPTQIELQNTDKNGAQAIYNLNNSNQNGVDIFLQDNLVSFSPTSKDLPTNCLLQKNKHPKDTSNDGTTKLEFARADSNSFTKNCAFLYELDTTKSHNLNKKDDGTRSLFGWRMAAVVFFFIVLGIPCLCFLCIGALVALVFKNACCE